MRNLIVIAILVFVNLLASGYFVRIDLTKEKRYSLSEISEETLEALEYPFYIDVYLEGDFPANIRQFQDALRTTLVEMKQYSGSAFDFQFIDPSKNPGLMESLRKEGIAPIPVTVKISSTETEQKLMYPVLALRYRDREQYVDLLKGCAFPNGQINFPKAESDLEYKLISAIRNLNRERRGLIAVLQGQGELRLTQQPDGRFATDMPELISELQGAYTVGALNLQETPDGAISPSIDVLIVLQPTRPFSEREKYEIDQYLMRGGSILWVLDQEKVDLDLYQKRSTLTELRDLNLDDQFMQYGFKVNYDLIQDLSCEATEVFQETAAGGSFLSKKWLFYPLIFDLPVHPVTRNTDAVLLRYASSIDTFALEGVKKSVFLQSSDYSRTIQGVQFLDLNEVLQNPPPQQLFNKGNRITGLMLEGSFTSLFKGRQAPVDSVFPEAPMAPFLDRSDKAERLVKSLSEQDSSISDRVLAEYIERIARPRRMAVISDGEFALGKMFREQRARMPYDNKTLLLNVIDYLAGDQTLTGIRSKEVVERRLDIEKVRGKVGLIQAINLLLPVLLVTAFGLLRFQLRRRRNARLAEK